MIFYSPMFINVLTDLQPLGSANCAPLGIACPPSANGGTIATVIQNFFIAPLFGLAATIAIGFIVFGGAKYIMSHGKEEQAAQAKNTVIFALLGLIIIAIAGILINAILNAVGT